jgi:hypothetical protein
MTRTVETKEEVTAGGPSKAPGSSIRKRVKFLELVDDKVREIIAKEIPEMDFIGSKPPSSHPMLRAARLALEHQAFQIFEAHSVTRVKDLRGNCQRTGSIARRKGLVYHSCNPIATAVDAARAMITKPAAEAFGETCSLDPSDCGWAADALLSVHSLYQYSPQQLFELVNATTHKLLLAVVHLFPGIAGSLPEGQTQEATYQIRGDQVTVRVKGESFTHQEASCQWLFGGGYACERGTLAWTSVREVFNTSLILFTITDAPVAISSTQCPRPGTFVEVDRRGLRSVQDVVSDHNTETHKVRGYIRTPYGYLVNPFGGRAVAMPDVLLSEAKLWMVGRDRTKATWAQLITVLRGKVGALRVPHEEQWLAVLYAAQLAFIETAKEEEAALVGMSPWRSMFERVREWVPDHSPLLKVSTVLSTLYDRGNRLWKNPFEVLNFLQEADVVTGAKSATPYSKMSIDPEHVGKPKIGSLDLRRAEMYGPKERAGHSQLVTFDHLVPGRCANDAPTQVAALNARLLAGEEEADWSEVLRTAPKWRHWFGIPVKVTPLEFEEWITVFGRHNDPKRVAALRKAHDELAENPNLLKFTLRPFIKDEAYPAKGAGPKPRMIAATNDHYLVATGPLTYPMGAALKELWHKDALVYYTSGATTEELGSWFAHVTHLFPRGLILEGDYSEFEARITSGAFETQFTFYELMLLVNTTLLRMQRRQRGKSNEGIRWSRKFGRSSGVGDTSVGNSVINATSVCAFFERSGLELRDHFRMAVLGDDNLIVISERMAEWFDAGAYEAYAAGLRMKLVFKAHANDEANWPAIEYCSGWFCRFALGEDIRTFWTPKSGRVLAKTFAIKPAESEARRVLRGMCLGMLAGPACPVLQAAAAALLLRTEGVEPKAPDRHTEWNPLIVMPEDWGAHPELVRPIYSDVAQRYNMSVEEVQEAIRYVATRCTSQEYPINLDAKECPPLAHLVQFDVGFEDRPVTINVGQSAPNLSSVIPEPVPLHPQHAGDLSASAPGGGQKRRKKRGKRGRRTAPPRG